MPASDLELWNDLGIRLKAPTSWDNTFVLLRNQYSAHGRHYHTLTHVRHCLDELSHLGNTALCFDSIELAIWLHDVVYDSQKTDNEKLSADWSTQHLSHAQVSPDVIQTVASLILTTRHSPSVPADQDHRIIIDCDLAILGQGKEIFDRYEQQIRLEYSWVEETLFRKKRGEFLQSLLARPWIFLTEEGRKRYETPARKNLERSLKIL